MKTRLSAGVLALVLAGCASDDRVSGGGGIEIPNGIDMAVRDSTGAPVASARVLVVAADDWADRVASGLSPVLDSSVTDAQGRASFGRCARSCWIEVFQGGRGARVSSDLGDDISVLVSGVSTVSGQIPADGPRAATMRLAGTDRVAAVDASGRFSFDGVAPGGYALVAEGVAGRGLLPAGSAVVGSRGTEKVGVAIDTAGLLIDDFSDADVVWTLRDLFGSSYWWFDAEGTRDSVFGISTAAEALRDSVGTHWLSFAADTARQPFAWANFGLTLGPAERRLPSLDHLAAVRIRVRGTGAWKLLLNRDSSGIRADSKAAIALSEDWTDVRVPVSDLDLAFGGGWRLLNIVFWTDRPGTLELGRVSLEGVGLQDWKLP